MNRAQKHNILSEIFRGIMLDGQWHEVTAPSGYKNRFRAHRVTYGPLHIFIVEAYSGNGFRPGDTIGTVTMHSVTGETSFTPLTFKRYLHNWEGNNNA